MKSISQSKQTAVNMAASIVTYGISILISFFLSPYIVENIDVSAAGFLTLANNFLGYVSLASVALNTLASRFVTISIYKNDNKEANRYFSSIFYANVFLSVAMAILFALVIIFIDDIFDVPVFLLKDVRLLFGVLFINSISNTIGSVFSVATFAKNKLYLSSIASIFTNIIRVLVLFLLFTFREPKLYYVGVSTLCAGVLLVLINYLFTKKLLPNMKIDFKCFELKKVKELISGGIWASVGRLGNILLNDLDMVISNIFINSQAMGVLSISKTIPSAINSLVGTVVAIFSPNYTILYAQGKHNDLVRHVKQSMKIMGILTNLPIIVLIVCGEQFFKLWQPTQDARELYILSLLSVFCTIFSGGINCIYNIFTVVNKLRLNAVVVIVSGIISTGIVFIMLKTTSLGLYAVAGVSSAVSLIRTFVFTAPYGAKCLKVKWYTFYPDIIRPSVYVVISCLVAYFPASLFDGDSWVMLILNSFITVSFSLAIGYLIILSKDDRAFVKGAISNRVLKRGGSENEK